MFSKIDRVKVSISKPLLGPIKRITSSPANSVKVIPISGVQRVVGLKALKTFLIDLLKFTAIGSVVWLTLIIFLDDPIFYAPVPIQHIPQFIYKLFLVMFTILLLMLTIIAIISYFIKKKEHDEEMKMTKQEVKEEKEQRGFK